VADETTPPEDDAPETPAAEGGEASEQANAPADDTPAAETPAEAADESGGPEEPVAGAEEADTAEEPEAAPAAEAEAPAEEPAVASDDAAAASDDDAAAAEEPAAADEDDEPETPRVKPAIPGMDLEVDIVVEGEDPLTRGAYGDEEDLSEAADEQLAAADDPDGTADQPIPEAAIDLAADARYTATGKRKTAIARVILKPGTGAYTINGKTLDEYFPRPTLQRNIRQPLETVGYETRMDVIARMHGGGVSAQAGALRHGISRALITADPNLRGELKRRGFLTRDARAKERKKAGLKKARKRPQFSKR
jgi:small subunit ribosomal protein S9